jgi:pimeloyl-ACP methyl ester carboxylesterase
MAYVAIPGARLWYTDSGGDGLPVVFVHPAAASSAGWVKQVGPFAAAGYRVVTYDLRGWGKSTDVADPTQPGYLSDDLEALVQALKLGRFYLVAAAYGGFGGLDYALRFQSARLHALVLATTQGGLADAEYRAVLERVVAPAIRDLPLHLRELGPSYRAEDPDGVRQWIDVLNRAGHHAPRQALRQHITLPVLATLRVPTLLLAADADLLAPPALMRMIAERIPGSQFAALADAGHSAHWERPADWNRLVLDFLSRVDR